MKKAAPILLMSVLLLGPSLPLLAVAVVMNPAAKGTSVMNSGLSVGQIPDSLTATAADGTTITLNKAQLTHAEIIITVGSRVEGTNRNAVALMAALTESSLRMLSNVSAYPESADYPNDGDGGDRDALGLFQTGDHVVAGQHIADVGSNRRSTGPHLHFEIRPNNDYSQVTDVHVWLAEHEAATLDGATTGPTGCYINAGRA
ncbi:MAG: M23 family metallopeptidase [Propionibacteriaceae bacterium]|jgi:hypothetical protein|nr:M23 family metallopeptidase [Propionibacteriaceae bacterium]